jgi:hypothetical protein
MESTSTPPASCRAPDGDEVPTRGRRPNWLRFGVLAGCVVIVLGFYVRSATTDDKSLAPVQDGRDFQNLLADAFLDGRLDLPIEVPQGLLELPDPYDPAANAPYQLSAGIHDLTLFDGKLYSYFGPTPVLLLYIPFRVLGVGDLGPTLATLIFCAGGFLASWGTFRIVIRRFMGACGLAYEAIAIIALGFCAPIGWLIHIGRAYETAIACGYFMASVGIYFICRGLFAGRRWTTLSLALGGMSLAGAVGARPNLALGVFVVVYAVVFVLKGEFDRNVSRRAALVALCVPYVVVGIALAAYNWMRFDSVAEFGTNYMLSGENVRLARKDEISLLVRGLYYYFLSPWQRRDEFPWIGLRDLAFPTPIETGYLLEPVAGLVPLMPAAVIGIIAFFCWPWRAVRRWPWLAAMLAVFVVVGFAQVALASYHIHGATMRYEMDFAPILLLASVIGFVVTVATVRSTRGRVALNAIALVAVAVSTFGSIAITTYACAGTGSC